MRNEYFKQMICISESNPDIFQEKMNHALYGKTNPIINMDQTMPFTAYIYYDVNKTVPEDLLELFEILDGNKHHCEECPHFEKDPDKRKKWHICGYYHKQTRIDSRACEQFYRERRAEIKELQKDYNLIPNIVE